MVVNERLALTAHRNGQGVNQQNPTSLQGSLGIFHAKAAVGVNEITLAFRRRTISEAIWESTIHDFSAFVTPFQQYCSPWHPPGKVLV